MRTLPAVLMIILCLASSVPARTRVTRVTPAPSSIDWRSQRKQLGAQQKQERRVLKAQQRGIKRSWRHQNVPRAYRIQAKHRMQRERRNLGLRQKDAMQDLKDRQRAFKESQRLHR